MNYKELLDGIKDKSESGHLITIPENKHYRRFCGFVHFMPTTRAQCVKHLYQIKRGYDDLLMCGQWHPVEQFLNEFGYSGVYSLTKSGYMCRLLNISDYRGALKKKFDI
jgi:hypothetical protein